MAELNQISPKWIEFAKNFQSLPEATKQIWLAKLSPSQHDYLRQILNKLEEAQKLQIKDKTIHPNPIIPNLNPKPSLSTNSEQNHLTFSNPSTLNLNFKEEPKKSLMDFKTEKKSDLQGLSTQPNQPSLVTQVKFADNQNKATQTQAALAQQSVNPARTLNLSLIMPKRQLNIRSKNEPDLVSTQINAAVISTPNLNNLSKNEYEKLKAQSGTQSVLTQAVLILMVLALPIGSVAFVMQNAKMFSDSKASSHTGITQAMAENNPIDIQTLDNQFDSWIVDFNDLSSADRTRTADPDNDGLTNFEEFALKTIPTNSRSCNGPRLDGENILSAIDPVKCKPVNFNDPAVAAKYEGVVPRSVINERLSLVALDRYLNSLKEQNSENTQNSQKVSENSIFDMDQTGELKVISKTLDNNESMSVGWVKNRDSEALLKQLEKQIAIYPTNTLPGEPGNIYLSGRGIVKGSAVGGMDLFTKLDQLSPGDILELSLKSKDGNIKKFYYKVLKQNLVLASDQKQFTSIKSKNSELTLAAPWPEYSPEHRLVVKATLERSE